MLWNSITCVNFVSVAKIGSWCSSNSSTLVMSDEVQRVDECKETALSSAFVVESPMLIAVTYCVYPTVYMSFAMSAGSMFCVKDFGPIASGVSLNRSVVQRFVLCMRFFG